MWLPIDTAPKDGTSIFICQAYDADGQIITGSAFGLFVHRAAWWGDECDGKWTVYNSMTLDPVAFFEPTHWMPIPPFVDQ